MHRKRILAFVSERDTIGRLEAISSEIDADVTYFDYAKIDSHDFTKSEGCDLLLIEPSPKAKTRIAPIENALLDKGSISVFFIVDDEDIETIPFPSSLPWDFASASAFDAELKLRLSRLLWPNQDGADSDFLRVGKMTVNLSTYQVCIDGEPLDLTYLEYKLLVFLMERPGKTFSREALLKYVWGFDYYGGSRTVDVHVRRLRAKLGPDCARYLMTVRGVGYYWSVE